MRPQRQLWSRLVLADVVLFVIASVFNDHSSTSVDGILWWLAIGGFVLLAVAASLVLLTFVVSRARRPRVARAKRPRRT